MNASGSWPGHLNDRTQAQGDGASVTEITDCSWDKAMRDAALACTTTHWGEAVNG
jgi:hypothetical protein